MGEVITVRLDDQLNAQLSKLAERTGRKKSDIVRDALRKQLAVDTFNQLRSKILPFAEAEGLLTDDDFFNVIS